MLIRVSPRKTTPLTWATTLVTGGALFHRHHLNLQRCVAPAVYKRSLPERRPFRRKSFRRRRPVGYVRLGLPRPWEPTLYVPPRPWWRLPQPDATRLPGVTAVHLVHRKWSVWAARRKRVVGAVWGFRSKLQNDPLLWRWWWAHRGGPSVLAGYRQPTHRGGQVHARWSGLLRRRRHYRGVIAAVERTKSYLTGYWHKRRRRLSPPHKRYHFFRRRRLRRNHRRGASLAGWLRGTTRRSYHRAGRNKFVRLEQAALFTNPIEPYYQGTSKWTIWTWTSRVGVPLEYNYSDPSKGVFTFRKKRRPDARRWKLGQHPRHAMIHQQARQLRWSWFADTYLAGLISPKYTTPPVTPGLASSLWWSTQVWGRGRWGRPHQRAARVFVTSFKSGHAVEVDATQWGATGTAAAGQLQAHAVENQLGTPSPSIVVPIPPVPPPPLVTHRFRWWWLRLWWVSVLWVWRWVVTPFWWCYSRVAMAMCGAVWLIKVLHNETVVLRAAASEGIYQFSLHTSQVWWDFVTAWVKERTFIKTAAWVWTSWLLAYTTDNEADELQQPTHEDQIHDLIHNEEFDQVDEFIGADDLAPGIRNPAAPPYGWDIRWHYDVDSFVDDWAETLVDWFTEEVPHQLGLFFRPLVDLLLRLPMWAVAEGATTAVLWFKLEWQRWWWTLLTHGNTPSRVAGRVWKVPLVLVAILCRVATTGLVWWWLFQQVDYSAFRVGLTYSWGLPWREEYYALWFFVSAATAVWCVGPVSWKNYLFQELGLETLIGAFMTTAALDTEESYYPNRPAGLVEKTISTHTAGSVKWEYYDLNLTTDSGATLTDRTGVYAYDDARLRLAQHYGLHHSGYDDEGDFEEWGFVFPFHQPAHLRPPWYSKDGLFTMGNRAARDPFAKRNHHFQSYNYGRTPILWTSPERKVHPRHRRNQFIAEETWL